MVFIFHFYTKICRSVSLTLCDGELAVSEHRAFLLVEGQVVDGGSHIHQQLLAFLHRPQLCVTHTQTHTQTHKRKTIINKVTLN